MAWDFSTEPEFQEKLDWIREFVAAEIEPSISRSARTSSTTRRIRSTTG